MITLERLDPTLKQHIEKIEHYKQVQTLLAWDARTGAPKKGASYAARCQSDLSGRVISFTDGFRFWFKTGGRNTE
ncbi:hypothetical protein E2R58_06005 [Paenibacillus amylolyticus]|uniref:hypothetical protein n=1 Tax=Paenibacillus amylolyticus TaxID=1451 RepID=UPI0010599FCB|nr:hypothetical protein [Paenibacillus amylolyticus]TDL68748.1 hypothetical protein E2R58_06005 [Paenibacillus amylolyticus]